ncbi:hypothetical protein E2C01_031166 [Portunus trituberculatus]|uniref:Uncharacterized protein n=1 Tax=Portunus trituberculatus TaxID=210409 RepID=A0A5B7EWW9_PORTR|nr:hypothetical protein [Portunus trituberculatus]
MRSLRVGGRSPVSEDHLRTSHQQRHALRTAPRRASLVRHRPLVPRQTIVVMFFACYNMMKDSPACFQFLQLAEPPVRPLPRCGGGRTSGGLDAIHQKQQAEPQLLHSLQISSLGGTDLAGRSEVARVFCKPTPGTFRPTWRGNHVHLGGCYGELGDGMTQRIELNDDGVALGGQTNDGFIKIDGAINVDQQRGVIAVASVPRLHA